MADTPPPTQRDIARQAGVNVSTVSLALRNHPSIPPATCRRIQQIAERMGYARDAVLTEAMQHLRRGRSAHQRLPLALLHGFPAKLDRMEEPHFAEYWGAARRRAEQLGYYIEEFWMRDPALNLPRLRQMLIARGIRGLLLSQPVVRPADNQLDFNLEGFVAVHAGRCWFKPHLHVVAGHQTYVARTCVQNVLGRGYRRIGLALPDDIGTVTDHEVEAMYYFVLSQERGLKPPPVFRSPDHDREGFLRWVRDEKPDVVVGPGFVYDWLRGAGYRAPRDIGFAGLSISPAFNACSGVDRRNEDQAFALVDLLVSHLQRNETGAPPFAKTVMIEGPWVDGGTLAPRL